MALCIRLVYSYSVTSAMTLGVSFDAEYARFLNLEPDKVFAAITRDWRFKHVRLAANWNVLEKKRGTYDFSELDHWMRESEKANVKVVLAVGQKTPRWPECHIPDWSRSLASNEYAKEFKAYITAVVNRYKSSSALEMWQVENEPFLKFGTCPPYSLDLYKEELALVKNTDNTHPTVTADSGELSTWRRTGTAADFFGTTLYRMVWNKYTGYWSYDWLPPSFYLAKLRLVGRPIASTFVMELQAEPWVPSGTLPELPLTEQAKSMDLVRLKKNLDFTTRLGVSRTYLWGAEWWYWLQQKGEHDIPNYIQQLPK